MRVNPAIYNWTVGYIKPPSPCQSPWFSFLLSQLARSFSSTTMAKQSESPPKLARSQKPRPLFVYGTLCAKPLLAWATTGDASNTASISQIARPARVDGYARFAIHHRDYPAAVKRDGASVQGYLLDLETTSQRKKLDDFEGEAYKPTAVSVAVSRDGQPDEIVEADMYLWDGEMDCVSSEPWDLEVFIRERLEDWIDLFEGTGLVGEGEDSTAHLVT